MLKGFMFAALLLTKTATAMSEHVYFPPPKEDLMPETCTCNEQLEMNCPADAVCVEKKDEIIQLEIQ